MAHEINQLKTRKCLTLLIDGWEDCQRCSIYGTMAAQVATWLELPEKVCEFYVWHTCLADVEALEVCVSQYTFSIALNRIYLVVGSEI